MKIDFQNDSFLASLSQPSELTVGTEVAIDNIGIASCAGSAGTFGTLGTLGGCAGTFGTAGTYGCGE